MDIEIKYLKQITPVIEKSTGVLNFLYREIIENSISWESEINEEKLKAIPNIDLINLPETIESLTFLQLLRTIRENLETEFTSNLNKSTLAGEHYNPEIFNITDNLKKLLNKLSDVISRFGDNNKDVSLFNNSFEPIYPANYYEYLDYYRRLSETVQVNLDFQNPQIHLMASFEEVVRLDYIKTEFVYSKEGNKDFLTTWYAVFLLNVKLAEVDDSLSCEMDKVRTLLKIQHYLQESEIKNYPIVEVLMDKSKYLLKKIAIRFKRDSKNSIILDDYDTSSLKRIELDQYKIIYFKGFDEKTIKYYANNLAPSDPEVKTNIDRIELDVNRNKVPIKYSDIHFLFKYYNKNFKSDSVLEKLKIATDYFEKNTHEDKQNVANKFEFDAYVTTHDFLYNTKLRILCYRLREKFKVSANVLTDLIKDLTDIEVYLREIEEKSQFPKNYFPSQLICKLYKDFLLHLNNLTDTANLKLETINDIIEKFNNQLAKCKINLTWCSKNNISTLYLPREDCIETIFFDKGMKDPIKALLDSSYILPLPYPLIKEEVELLNNEFEKYKALLLNKIIIKEASLREAAGEIALKNVATQLEEREKQQTSNYIQILAVFAAILTFAFGSIKVVPDLKTVNAIIAFMVGFAAALAIFVSIVLYIISALMDDYKRTRKELWRDFKDGKIRWGRAIIFVFYMIIIISAFAMVFYFNKGNEINTSDSDRIKINKIACPSNQQSQTLKDTCCGPQKIRVPCPPGKPKGKPCSCDTIMKELHSMKEKK